MVKDLLLRDGCVRLSQDKSTGFFVPVRCWDPDHGHIGHGGMLEDQSLEFGGGHLVRFHFDQLLDPVDDVEAALVVDICDVSGPQPALAVRGEGVLRRLRVAPVAFHDVWAATPEFARVARAALCDLSEGVVPLGVCRDRHDLGLAVGIGFAYTKGGGNVVRVPSEQGAGHLRHPPALLHVEPVAAQLLNSAADITSKRGRSTIHGCDAAQVILLRGWMLGQRDRNRGHDSEVCDFESLDVRQHLHKVELGHDVDWDLSEQTTRNVNRLGHGMIERQEAEPSSHRVLLYIVGKQSGKMVVLKRVCDIVVMCHFDALRHASRARGVVEGDSFVAFVSLNSC